MNNTTETDARIDAALEPTIKVQDYGDDGSRLLTVHVSNRVGDQAEVYVYRTEQDTDDGMTTRTEWTICAPLGGPEFGDGTGDFTSPAAVRNYAASLFYAVQLADRLQEAGR